MHPFQGLFDWKLFNPLPLRGGLPSSLQFPTSLPGHSNNCIVECGTVALLLAVKRSSDRAVAGDSVLNAVRHLSAFIFGPPRLLAFGHQLYQEFSCLQCIRTSGPSSEIRFKTHLEVPGRFAIRVTERFG